MSYKMSQGLAGDISSEIYLKRVRRPTTTTTRKHTQLSLTLNQQTGEGGVSEEIFLNYRKEN